MSAAGKHKWIYVAHEGISGYVAARYVGEAQDGKVTVNTKSGPLNIRKGPGLLSPIISRAKKGAVLTLLPDDPGNTDEPASPANGNITVAEYLANLEAFCNSGWTYGAGYKPGKKVVDCAWYPYVARNRQGAHGATSEYAGYLSERGKITTCNDLIPGMEVFQADPKRPGVKSHMGVYAGRVELNGTVQHAVYQSCSSHRRIDAKYNHGVPGDSGPNLTGMNGKWTHWGWSKYVEHE